MQTDLQNVKAKLQKATSKPETAFSKRYLKVLEKWIPLGVEFFADWPVRPNCGHFLGGCHWYGIETIAGAVTFAAAASSPDYDEKTTGCSREDLQTMALKAIRYLCYTHDSGPEDCVRPEKGLGRKENFGTKWGERGKGFFRESQCGTTISGIAITALLLGDRVDEETWKMIETVHADYAERFGEMAPKSGVYRNTQMEENGWTSCGLASVEQLLQDAPNAKTWTETAQRWMFSTASAPQDNKDHRVFANDKTVSQLTGDTYTALPDFMAENHGMVHPNYTASSVLFTGYLGVIYGAYGTPVPKHAYFNRQKIYDQLKLTTDRTGSMHPVQGMDWPYLFTDPGTTTHAAASILLNDADAARMELWALETLEGRQDSNDGRMYDPEVAEVCHDVQDPMIIRECLIAGPAYTYLLHRLQGDGPKPTPDAELEKKLRGVKIYPHSGFAFQRHKKGQTSFAWRNCQMALPLNKDGIQTVAPASNSWLAKVTVKNQPDSQEEISVSVDAQQDGFASALVMHRAQGSVRQEVLYASLPDGVSLSFERWIAESAVTVSDISQGFLRIVNETFKAMDGNCNGFRIIHTPTDSDRFEGFVSADEKSDIIKTYDHPAWLNVDGRLGIVFQGTGETVYHNRHYFNPWWATADDLTLSRQTKPKRFKTGEEITKLSALITPDQSPKKTAQTKFIELSGTKNCVGLIGQDHLAVANFAQQSVKAKLSAKRKALTAIPIFEGTTQISDKSVTYPITLQPGQAGLKKALMVLDIKGQIEVTASTSSVIINNVGKKSATIKTGKKTIKIKAGQMIKV